MRVIPKTFEAISLQQKQQPAHTEARYLRGNASHSNKHANILTIRSREEIAARVEFIKHPQLASDI